MRQQFRLVTYASWEDKALVLALIRAKAKMNVDDSQITGSTGGMHLSKLWGIQGALSCNMKIKTATYSNVPTKNYEYHIFISHAISELLTEL